jgi:cell division protein FtsX
MVTGHFLYHGVRSALSGALLVGSISDLLCYYPQLVIQVKAFRQQFTDTTLALGNISVDDKLAVYAHVVQ